MHRVFIIKINNRNINPENISALTFRDCINAFINTITIIVYLIENSNINGPSSIICDISILLLIDNYIVTIAINRQIKKKILTHTFTPLIIVINPDFDLQLAYPQ